MTWWIPAAATVAGSLLGGAAGAGDRDAATGVLKDIYAKYANLQIPDTEKMRLALEDYKSAGDLSAQSETAQQLGERDAFEDISVDPRLRQAQMDQLQALSRLGETSFTPAEQAQLNKMQRQVEADNQSRLKSLLQGQQMRGVGSSDAALAVNAISAQSAANRQAEQADDLASMAFNRALQARAGAADLGGSMENRQYGQAANLATAKNTRELQNMLQKSSVGSRNVDRQSEAQKFNLANKQDILNRNVGQHNAQQQYNKELEQKRYENELAKLRGMSGAGTPLSSAYGADAERKSRQVKDIAGGTGDILAGFLKK